MRHIPQFSCYFFKGEMVGVTGIEPVTPTCQRKVQYLNEYLKYLYLLVLMELRNYNLRLSLLNPYISLLSGCSSSTTATALSACT